MPPSTLAMFAHPDDEALLVLASKSPRRSALLRSLGLEFVVDEADVNEEPVRGEVPDALAVRLSRAKASAVAARNSDVVVLAADTVVALDGVLLGKPRDPADAVVMLERLRDRTHQVHTAVSLARNGRLTTRLSTSNVTMRAYADEEIQAYVATGDPLDKAGAYAIQHPDFRPVARWEGCYTGIMGLPLGETAELLRKAGILLPVDVADVCERISGRCCLRDAQ